MTFSPVNDTAILLVGFFEKVFADSYPSTKWRVNQGLLLTESELSEAFSGVWVAVKRPKLGV
jgi:hypothetical protein